MKELMKNVQETFRTQLTNIAAVSLRSSTFFYADFHRILAVLNTANSCQDLPKDKSPIRWESL